MADLYTRQDDERILEIIDAVLDPTAGYKGAMAKFGATKGAVAGIMNRYRASALPCKCRRKANKNGGQPARWWAA